MLKQYRFLPLILLTVSLFSNLHVGFRIYFELILKKDERNRFRLVMDWRFMSCQSSHFEIVISDALILGDGNSGVN